MVKDEQFELREFSKWLIVVLLMVSGLAKVAIQYACSAFLPLITEELNLTGAQQGTFSSIQSLIQMLGVLFGALIAYKLGAKRTFALANLLYVVSAVIMAGGSYELLVLGRACFGVSTGIAVIFNTTIINNIFDNKKVAVFCLGVLGMTSYAGRYVGLAMAYPLLDLLGSYGKAFIALSLISVVVVVLWYVIYPSAEKYQGRSSVQASGIKTVLLNIKKAWSFPIIRRYCIYFFFSAMTAVVIGSYMPTYFVMERGMEKAAASALFSYNGILGIAGALLGGVVASRTKIKFVVIPSELISGCIILACLLLPKGAEGALLPLICLYGFLNAAQSTNNRGLAFKQPGITSEEVTAGTTLANFSLFFASWLTAQIFGIVYPIVGIKTAMFIWTAFVFIGAIVAMTIPEPKNSEV